MGPERRVPGPHRLVEDSMATHIEHETESQSDMKQTLIWLGVMLIGVIVVGYFYI